MQVMPFCYIYFNNDLRGRLVFNYVKLATGFRIFSPLILKKRKIKIDLDRILKFLIEFQPLSLIILSSVFLLLMSLGKIMILSDPLEKEKFNFNYLGNNSPPLDFIYKNK
jgi:hypothetical protein